MTAKKYIGKITDDVKMSCSRLPALLGKSSWSTPNDELRKSINAQTETKHKDNAPSEQAHWGNVHEGAILQEIVKRLQLQNEQLEITTPVKHKQVPLEGSLDGLADGCGLTVTTDKDAGIFVIGQNEITLHGVGVLEAKSTTAFPEDVPADSRGPIQVQGLMACGGYNWAAIGVLYQGSTLRIFLYERDPALIEKLENDVLDFQNRVDNYNLTGDLDAYPVFSANDAVETYGQSTDTAIDLTGKDAELVEDLLHAKITEKSVKKYIGELQAAIMNAMGEHSTAYVRDEDNTAHTQITWGMTPARNQYTVAARPAQRSKSIRVKELS